MQAKTGATSKNSEDFPGDAISQHSEPSASGSSEKDTFRIFVCTDNHLGANEKDPIRGNDSFIAFEECLQYAKDNNADFVLLGGDLFHENKPSRSCLVKTIELLRYFFFLSFSFVLPSFLLFILFTILIIFYIIIFLLYIICDHL